MKLILCKSNKIGSKLLRFYMWSSWSHSAIYDDEQGLIYDTTMLGGGCKVHTVMNFFSEYTDWEIRDIEIKDKDKAREWLKNQLGKKYDWTALFGIYFRRNWQEDDKWFCSEHTETFISLFSKPRFRSGNWKITVFHQEMLL